MRLPNPASLTPAQRHEYRLAHVGKRADTFEQLDDGTLFASGTFKHTKGVRFYLAAFLSKALRPEPRYLGCYVSEADRTACIERIKQARHVQAAAQALRRAERNRPHSLKVGDVLVSSWGWEQTNIDFFEVIAVRGAVIDLHKVAKTNTSTGDMTGLAVPKPGQYVGDVLRGKRPTPDNRVRLTSFSSARPWDGKPEAWSSYA